MLLASNIQTIGSGDINLTSQTGDVNVMAGINSSTTVSSSSNRDFDSIGFSHTHSSVGMDFTQTGNENTTTVTQTSMASSILSSANNINISSGSSLLSSSEGGSTNILASTLSADNQINITANKELNIKSVEEVSKIVSDSSDVTNTITLSVGNAWLGLADSTVQSAKKIEDSSNSKTDDKAKAANATAASAQIGMNILQAIVTAPSFGFYGAVTDTLSKTTTTSETDYITNAASNLYATNDINLTSNSNLTIKGSNVYSENGDINLRSKEGNVNIQAAQNSVNSSSSIETNSISETVSVSGGGIWVSIPTISTSSSSSDLSSTSYLSSNLNASNGTININAKEDTNVIGSSILGKDVTITTNNLNVESLQSKLTSNTESDSYSLGGNIGFNNSDNSQDRLWTDNIASIIGTNSVTINTENNTNIVGGVIANSTNGLIGSGATDGNNLTINTKTLTYSNLQDHNNSETNAIGINVGLPVGFSGSSPTNLSLVADARNTNLGLSYAANSSAQTGETKATIGQGTINLNSTITRDATTGEVTSITDQETITNDDSRIANLNRDVTTNQVDNGTHYEGGYNINLNINFAVAAEAANLTSQEGRNYLLQQAKDNLGGTAKLYGDAAVSAYNTVSDISDKIYNQLFPAGISDPQIRNEVREAIRQAALNGDTETLKDKVKELTGIKASASDLEAITNLSTERDFAKLRNMFSSDEEYQVFAAKYTLQVGVFFDGTANDRNSQDPEMAEETNVVRMKDLYDAIIDPKYITGVGTSGGLDTACQAFGCGISDKQQQAKEYLINEVINSDEARKALFLPIDIIDFSRGATTGSDFINKINNEDYWNLGLMPRSHLSFDPVGSYGLPGNGIDLGRDFSTPSNVIAIQINAVNETRNLFDLQSLYNSTGQNPNPDNWLQITLPGVHADIGGGYANGYQGKTQDMAFYSMQTMINEAQKYGINFKDIPTTQQPSTEFNQLMNLYNQAQTNLINNPSQQNQTYFNGISGLIKDLAVHDSTIQSDKFWQIYNYSIGDQRGAFYPNNILQKTGN